MECLCCYEDVNFSQTVCCNSKKPHFFCFKCMNKHFETLLKGSRIDLSCLYIGACTGAFEEKDLGKFMSSDTMLHYNTVKDRTSAKAVVKDIKNVVKGDLISCCFCGGDAIDDREYKYNLMVCPNPECKKLSCIKCKKEWHSNTRCISTDSERTRKEESETYKIIKACPNCNVDIFRTKGCNHVKCICKTIVCYLCGEDITSRPYSHPCPMIGDKPKERIPTHTVHERPVVERIQPHKAQHSRPQSANTYTTEVSYTTVQPYDYVGILMPINTYGPSTMPSLRATQTPHVYDTGFYHPPPTIYVPVPQEPIYVQAPQTRVVISSNDRESAYRSKYLKRSGWN